MGVYIIYKKNYLIVSDFSNFPTELPILYDIKSVYSIIVKIIQTSN